MSPAEVIASGAALFTGACTIGGLIYMRGTLDAHAQTAKRSIDTLAKKFDEIEKARNTEAELRGAQGVRNELTTDLAKDVRHALNEGIKIATRLDDHISSCGDRQDTIEKRFDKMEARITGGLDSLRAEVKNIKTGEADSSVILPANRPSRRARG